MKNRLESIPKTKNLNGVRVVITGCGYKPINHVFCDIVSKEPSHDSISIKGEKVKLNIGSVTAFALASNGATVHMVSSSEDKLRSLKEHFEGKIKKATFEFSVVNLLDEQSVKSFVRNLPKDKPIYWVQSLGLGAGSYKVKDDNPYLPLEDIDLDLMKAELSLVPATHIMMQSFLPIFKKQKETRITIISSMSATRGYSLGGTHCSAKGAIDRYANAAMLGLYKENIFITTIRPGGVDTGMYDSPSVQKAAISISKEYGGKWDKDITLMPPISVAEAVCYSLTTSAHVSSVNIVAKAQFPNESS